MMSTRQILEYYIGLLILQYKAKPNASGTIGAFVSQAILPQTTVQTLTFSDVSASGLFILNYGLDNFTVNWNDPTPTIQSNIQTISGLSSVTVSGSIASKLLTFTFTGVTPPALTLVISGNTLKNSGNVAISVSVDETDETLPLAVQDAFNLTGSDTASGVQLDIIGKYVGANRTYFSTTLNDTDFLSLIQFAIARNNHATSLESIQNLLNEFFPGDYILIDYTNMRIAYIFNTSLVNIALLNIIIGERFLHIPMAVGVSIILAPDVNEFFGFWTYDFQNNNNQPFNTYDSFDPAKVFLNYDQVFTA